jgi:hypothetical protein
MNSRIPKFIFMKHILTIALIFLLASAEAQQHQLQKLWETDTIVAIPESVLYTKDGMFVSLIDGAPWEADGKGGIAKIGTDGKNYNGTWIAGLHAPKGLGIYGNNLYAADMGDVVVVDISKGAIAKRIAVPGANGLNDITVSDKGVVYVSDSRTGKVWKIENDNPQLFMDSVRGVNGLKAVGDNLLVAAGRSFISVNPQKQVTKIAELPMGLDGIEPIGNGDYLTTAWNGFVYYVYADGRIETLLDATKDKKNTADLGYDPVKKILYVPTFNAKTVIAYQLK